MKPVKMTYLWEIIACISYISKYYNFFYNLLLNIKYNLLFNELPNIYLKKKSYQLPLYTHYSKRDTNLIWKLNSFNCYIRKYVGCLLINQIWRSSLKLFEEERKKKLYSMKKMKDFKWLQVPNLIFDIFYLNINFVGRNVMLNNKYVIIYKI